MRRLPSATAVILGLATLAAPVHAETKTFVCDFNSGVSTTFENGAFVTKAPAPLQFQIVDIDLEGQSANLLTGPAGTVGKLRIIRALNANHYLEVVTEGFLNLTTIYDLDPKAGAHPAIHSRHFGVLGQPVTAQFTGLCRPQ